MVEIQVLPVRQPSPHLVAVVEARASVNPARRVAQAVALKAARARQHRAQIRTQAEMARVPVVPAAAAAHREPEETERQARWRVAREAPEKRCHLLTRI
jgi:hypothetical protein